MKKPLIICLHLYSLSLHAGDPGMEAESVGCIVESLGKIANSENQLFGDLRGYLEKVTSPEQLTNVILAFSQRNMDFMIRYFDYAFGRDQKLKRDFIHSLLSHPEKKTALSLLLRLNIKDLLPHIDFADFAMLDIFQESVEKKLQEILLSLHPATIHFIQHSYPKILSDELIDNFSRTTGRNPTPLRKEVRQRIGTFLDAVMVFWGYRTFSLKNDFPLGEGFFDHSIRAKKIYPDQQITPHTVFDPVIGTLPTNVPRREILDNPRLAQNQNGQTIQQIIEEINDLGNNIDEGLGEEFANYFALRAPHNPQDDFIISDLLFSLLKQEFADQLLDKFPVIRASRFITDDRNHIETLAKFIFLLPNDRKRKIHVVIDHNEFLQYFSNPSKDDALDLSESLLQFGKVSITLFKHEILVNLGNSSFHHAARSLIC